MAGIKNGNKDSPPPIDPSTVKIVVVGEPRCGKTVFIRAFHSENFPVPEYSRNGVRVRECEFEINGELRPIAILEIPSDPDFLQELRMPHYVNADIFIFMYAIDDPASLEMLFTKWKPETSAEIVANLPYVALLGNKMDLRDDPQVIARLALENKTPVTPEQTSGFIGPEIPNSICMEISSNDPYQVLGAFTNIINLAINYTTV